MSGAIILNFHLGLGAELRQMLLPSKVLAECAHFNTMFYDIACA